MEPTHRIAFFFRLAELNPDRPVSYDSVKALE
jgi:hypothetical protein